MKIEDLKVKYDLLQNKYGDKSLDSIYNGGCENNPDICFVFMNPTGRNIASLKSWKGRKSPWIGTKNIWALFYNIGLLDENIYSQIREIKGKDWTYEFADKVYANVLAITLKTKDFRDLSHQKKLSNATNNTIEIYQEVMNLLDNLNITIPIRNIGMRLGDLQKDKKEQMSLFNKKDSQDDKIMKIMDDINLKYKETKIMPAIFYKNK